MQIGFIGLGKMGSLMVERLLRDGHNTIGFDLNSDNVKAIIDKGSSGVFKLEELIEKMESPRRIWLMVPSGEPVQRLMDIITPLFNAGDLIIDGGNSYYKDSVRRYNELKKLNIDFLDVGTSGGIWGLKEGYCVMVGGERKVYEECEPIFKSLAPENGYMYIGAAGAGHYVKMIHNGIEYGMMQAYAEGFELMNASDYKLDLEGISNLWNHGSVVRSWLLELLNDAMKKDKDLRDVRDYVEDSGEGRWTVIDGIEKNIPLHVITDSLYARFRSRQDESFGAKILAALRNEFGGHNIKKKL